MQQVGHGVDGSDDTTRFGPSADQRRYRGAQTQEQDLLDAASWELVEAPTIQSSTRSIVSLPTFTLIVAYFCTFGAELCINTILGAFYFFKFPSLGQTGSGNWAAMFGLLNVFFRPAGGIVSDIIYKHTKSLWAKKMWIHFVGIVTGGFMLAIGLVNSHNQSTMFGLVAGMAFFLDAGNGANFALVPHVHPFANGKPSPPFPTLQPVSPQERAS
jgi:NNP family nitrate/nitrite transporter-like MFS transporter